MNNKTKIILTAIGLAAIVVPAILLMVFSKKAPDASSGAAAPAGSRQLNKDAIEREVKSGLESVIVKQTPTPVPLVVSPSPVASPKSSTVTTPLESTASGH